jgi:hypothetical protein
MTTLDLTLVVSAVAAYSVAFARLADKARWAWHWAPPWAQVALPALVVALPELALALAGVKTWTEFGQALLVAGGAVAAAFRGALPPTTFAKLPADAKAALRDARTPAADRPLGTRSLTPVRPSDRAPASRSIPPPLFAPDHEEETKNDRS